MVRKLVTVSVMVVLALSISLWYQSSASAACRDDCYSDCCGGDSLCQGDEEVSCLTSCLKDCGGEDVPAVPAPTPVDEGDDEGEQTNN